MNTLTYDTHFSSERFERRFMCLYRWLVKRRWNPCISSLEADVIDCNYTIEQRKFTEHYKDKEVESYTIRCKFLTIIFVY